MLQDPERGSVENPELCRAILKSCFPDLEVSRLDPVSGGLDNFVVEVNDEYIFRFPRRADAEERLRKEVHLLPRLTRKLSVQVPRFDLVWRGRGAWKFWCVGYRKIRGEPMEPAAATGPAARPFIESLSRVLSELHGFSLGDELRCHVPSSNPLQWWAEMMAFYLQVEKSVSPLLEPSIWRKADTRWKDFLRDKTNFCFRPVLIHRDIGMKHILFDPERQRISGVIDWGGCSVGDPAFDFGCLLSNYGRGVFSRLLAGYGGEVDRAFPLRADFYSKILPYYELLFGVLAKDIEHIENGIARLEDTRHLLP